MFWKIALGLGIFGAILGIVILIVSVKSFYGASYQSNDEDIAFAGTLGGALILIFSLLLFFISGIFVLRNSKKEWDAQNPK